MGLENIAQTCYMNSLFQYYFTVKPLREAILYYEQHEEGDLTDEELKKKQISKWELQRSKRCNLFLCDANSSHRSTSIVISTVDYE